MTRGLHWFRRDLRLRDNTALAALQREVDEWLPVFVADPRLWGAPGGAVRKRFLRESLQSLERDLAKRGIPLVVCHGHPEEVLPELVRRTGASLVSCNQDASPFSRHRDEATRRAVETEGAEWQARRDAVVFDADEVLRGDGGSYSVYTPYRNAWWRRWREDPRWPSRAPRLNPPIEWKKKSQLDALVEPEGAADVELPTAGEAAAGRRLDRFLEQHAARYHLDRDRPDRDGTSRLSPYLRFGTLSVRQCLGRGIQAYHEEPALREGVGKWLDELVWREFYFQLLVHHPRVLSESFRAEYDAMVWEDDEAGLAAWREGRTGFPIVDAGMRQLLQTGWMHNRVRMIVASFLTKDLLVHWRRGEEHFFDRLVDGEPASNNGGWQWAASTGSDAQPFFRIFNPTAQGKRWDPEGRYVRRYVPELAGLEGARVHTPWDAPEHAPDYPQPIVDHAERRALALERFEAARAAAR